MSTKVVHNAFINDMKEQMFDEYMRADGAERERPEEQVLDLFTDAELKEKMRKHLAGAVPFVVDDILRSEALDMFAKQVDMKRRSDEELRERLVANMTRARSPGSRDYVEQALMATHRGQFILDDVVPFMLSIYYAGDDDLSAIDETLCRAMPVSVVWDIHDVRQMRKDADATRAELVKARAERDNSRGLMRVAWALLLLAAAAHLVWGFL